MPPSGGFFICRHKMTAYKIAAIILAAGDSSRMGTPKSLLKIGQSNFHDTILERLTGCPFDPLITVIGKAGAEIIRNSRVGKNHLFVNNPQTEQGQLSSLQYAIRKLPDDVHGCLVALVDHPLVKKETYQQLYDLICVDPQRIIIPVYQQQGGHPVYFGRKYFKSLLKAPLSIGARSVVEKYSGEVFRWPVKDPGVRIDIDTPADYKTHV